MRSDHVEIGIVLIALIVGFYFKQELTRIESRLAGTDDDSYDKQIDSKIISAIKASVEHKERLLVTRKSIPGLELFDIANAHWEARLLSGAEALRPLAGVAFGNSPDTWHFEQRALSMPMTFDYAHALARFATADIDLAIAEMDADVTRIGLAGIAQKRGLDLATTANAQRDLREIEKRLEKLEHQKFDAARTVSKIVCSNMVTQSSK
jgi:hypothetical protein